MDDTMTSLTRGVGTFLYRAPEVAAARPGQHYAGQETKIFDTTSICKYSHGLTCFFHCLKRTRREKTIRPKISRIDFDVTELERFEVW